MTATIVNAAPMVIFQGTQDLSTRQLAPQPEVLPTHLPKFYTYAKQGPLDPQLVVGDSATQMYGVDTFDMRKPYATHATAYINTVNAQGNSFMCQRLQPADAAPPASLRISLDVLPTQITVYARNSDGSITMDVNGNPVPAVPAATVAGYKAKWVVSVVPTNTDGSSNFNQGVQGPGDQTDGSGNTSIRYPIFDIVVSSFGTYGNSLAVRIWAPTTQSVQPIDPSLISQQIYPIRMACYQQPNALSTAAAVNTLYGEQYVDCCLVPGTIDNNTDSQMYAGDVFLQAYTDITSPGNPPIYGPFGQMAIYNNEIETLIGMFYVAEKPFFNSFSDMTGAANEQNLFNFIGGTSSEGVPYTTYQLVTGVADSVQLSANSNLFMQGGFDGTMNETLFAGLVGNAIQAYADPTSTMQNLAKYPESIFYDSGFPLAVKKQLASFIALRKDTFLVLSTHDVLQPQLTAPQESSIALSLQTFCQMYPESDFFGTPCMRAMIVGRSGTCVTQPLYNKPLPVSLEIANKAAAYMGSGDGIWKSGFSFDSAPGNILTLFTNVNVSFTPTTVRNKDWANGLNWVDDFDRRSLFFPALKTVYNNDTSVLNSFFAAMACCELEKVGWRAWRQFTGNESLTNAQLLTNVNKFITNNVTGRFDGKYVIIPAAYMSQADLDRGYSWSTAIKIYAPNMKTVMTLGLQAYRISDLPTT